MQIKHPKLIYFLINIVIVIIIIFSAIMFKRYLDEKFFSKKASIGSNTGAEPTEERQAKGLWALALMIFSMLLLIFFVFKFATRKSGAG